MSKDKITFSFGKNWKNYLEKIGTSGLKSAKDQIEEWVVRDGKIDLSSSSVIDIGSGSGLMSLSFYLLGAKEITSFDYDIHSVESTKYLKNLKNNPDNWQVFHGSILDDKLVNSLKKFDVVYSWGVLHHTGSMWQAIENASKLVKKDGIFYFSIYTSGKSYPKHLELKRKYNNGNWFTKKRLELRQIKKSIKWSIKSGNGFWNSIVNWNRIKEDERGMNVYHDIIDWLGGLPYEVASPNEIDLLMTKLNFSKIRISVKSEGGCSEYLYRKQS